MAGHVYVWGVSWNTQSGIKEPGRKMEKSKKGDGGEGGEPLAKELGAGAVFVVLPSLADPSEDMHPSTGWMKLTARGIAFPPGNWC